MGNDSDRDWDAFISHASEDRADFVEPLAAELQKYGLKIWFDQFTLQVGSSLRESIDEGLSRSRFGIVVLSPRFFEKNWPKKELNALFSRQVAGSRGIILPIWHGLTDREILSHSPLLSDIVASKSSDGVPNVAKALVGVIRPEAFRFDVSRRDAQNAIERMRHHVRDLSPWLDARVTFGPGQVPDLSRAIAMPKDEGVVASSVFDGMKIEIIATNPEEYNKNPIVFKVGLSQEGAGKLRAALLKGESAELGPGEFLSFSFPLFQSLHPPSDLDGDGQRLIVGPLSKPAATEQKIRLTLAIALDQEREEFEAVEFTLVRAENGKAELTSSSTALPLVVNLSFNVLERLGTVRIRWRYSGFEIRDVFKADKAVGLFRRGGTLAVSGLGTEQFIPLAGEQLSPLSDAEEFRRATIEQVHDIATVLDENITWPTEFSKEDLLKIHRLHEAVMTGRTSLLVEEIQFTVKIMPGIDADSLLQQPAEMLLSPPEPPDFATVLGRTFQLGAYGGKNLLDSSHYTC